MINIRFDGLSMEATGHAGYAEKGKDIVCAAASALFYAAAECLSQMGSWEKMVECPVILMRPGYVKLACEPRTTSQEEAELLFNFLETGCRLLAEEYPEYISVVTAT